MVITKVIHLSTRICLLMSLLLYANATFGQYEQITINKSDTVIDGNGGLYNAGKASYIYISSQNTTSGWIQTKNVTIKNITVRGGIRIMGLGKNGQAAAVKESSLSLGHTERAQAAAPTNITISNVVFEATEGLTAIYIAPGTTHVTVENCTFTGTSSGSGPLIYLDAESGYNTFRNNGFGTTVGREVIACDGSAYNLFENNMFNMVTKGGIYLYRNCGEGGAIRHQTPNHNVIRNNTFNLTNLVLLNYGIWLGSRNGNRTYCNDDAGYSFGSSIDDHDFADDNTVSGNTFSGSSSVWQIKNDGADNDINLNTSVKNVTFNDSNVLYYDKKIVCKNVSSIASVRVFDSIGNVVLSAQPVDSEVQLPDLEKGVYLVQLSDSNKMCGKKFIVD